MVRLMLVLAPVMCILSGIAVSAMLVTYMKQVDAAKNVDKKARKFESNFVMKSEVSECHLCLMIKMIVSSCMLQDYVLNCSFLVHFVPCMQGCSGSKGTDITEQCSM